MEHIDWLNQPEFDIRRYTPLIFKVSDPTNTIIRVIGIGLLLSFFIPVVIPLPGGLKFLFPNTGALLGTGSISFQLKFQLLYPLASGVLLIFASGWKRSVFKSVVLVVTGAIPFLFFMAGAPVSEILGDAADAFHAFDALVILPALALIVVLAGAHATRLSPYRQNKILRNTTLVGGAIYFILLVIPIGGNISLYEFYELTSIKYSGEAVIKNSAALTTLVCFFLGAILAYHSIELKQLSTQNARRGKHIANLWLMLIAAVSLYLGIFAYTLSKPAEMSGLSYFIVIFTVFVKLVPWIAGLFYIIPIGIGELFVPRFKKPPLAKTFSPGEIPQKILQGWSSLPSPVRAAAIAAAVVLIYVFPIRGIMSSGSTAGLFKMVKGGDLGKVRGLVGGSANLNAIDKEGKTPLHWAASNGHATVVRALFQKKRLFSDKPEALAGPFDKEGKTPLLEASSRGYTEVVRVLLANGADTNARVRSTNTALMEAARGGHVEIMKMLIANGADVNTCNDAGFTALHMAAMAKQPAAVELLIKNGAGGAPVPKAKQDFYYKLVNYDGFELIKAVSRKEAQTRYNPESDTGKLFLHRVVSMGNAEVVRILLEGGFKKDIDNKDHYGSTPLHAAVDMGYEDMVRVLLEAGADANVRDSRKRTPIHYAVYHDSNTRFDSPHWTTDRSGIVQLLIRHDADVNASGDQGNSPLHEAVARGILEEVKLLVENRARTDARNDNGKTPLEMHMRTDDDDNHDRIRERNKINRYLESLKGADNEF